MFMITKQLIPRSIFIMEKELKTNAMRLLEKIEKRLTTSFERYKYSIKQIQVYHICPQTYVLRVYLLILF